jgi:pimeloyl-ACP methyl ester carboxylesterase
LRFTIYLLGQKTPEQVAAERPDLARVWPRIRGGAEAPPHYGRPYAWHWQAAQKNFLDAWSDIDAPVFVAYAEYDQFEPQQSHQVIVDTVNRMRPGSARFLILEGLDHSLQRFPDEFAAYRGEGGKPGRDAFLVSVIAWLGEQTATP